MSIIVCDTCSIIKLQKGGVIDLLGEVYDKVYIPYAVKEECFKGAAKEAIKKPFFEVVPVRVVLPLHMGAGERESISLALELGIEDILTDDKRAINSAIKNNLVPMTAFDFLLISKEIGLISQIKPVLDQMRIEREGIEEWKYQYFLNEAGEL